MIGYTFKTKRDGIELELNTPSKSKYSNDEKAVYMLQFLSEKGYAIHPTKTGLTWPKDVPQANDRFVWLESKEHIEAFAECLEASEKESYLKIVKDSFKPKPKIKK